MSKILKILPTVSNRELGSAPVNEAIKTLIILAPRGMIMLFLIDKYCSPLVDFSRSKISDKKVNIELEASLQTNKKRNSERESAAADQIFGRVVYKRSKHVGAQHNLESYYVAIFDMLNQAHLLSILQWTVCLFITCKAKLSTMTW